MIQQPTRSTLFPYTTLFRSILETIENRTRGRHLEGLVRRKQPGFRIHARCHCGLERFWAADRSLRVARGAAVLRGDRKSTRLNSSHANISYAVFCLKKKNNM